MKSNRFRKPVIITLVVILALFLAGLIGTPYLIDLGVERWIASQGPEIGKVENVDFNPFTGRLSMDNLVVETQSGRTLNITHAYLQFSWKQLFKKQLYLSELVLQDVFMLVDRLEESGFRVGGLIINELIGSEKKSDAPGWEVGIGHFELQDSRIEYDTPELAATYFIDRYTLRGLETWNKQKPVDMELAGRINHSPFRVKAEIKPLAAVKSWKGNIKLEKGSLELFAKLEGLQEYAPSGSIDLDLDLDMQVQEDITIGLTADGAVTLKQLQVKYEKYGLQQEQVAWQGSITGSQSAEQGLALALDGQLTGTGLAVDDSVVSMELLLGAFNCQGKAGFKILKEDISVQMTADLDLSAINAKDRKNEINLLGLEIFNIAGIEITSLQNSTDISIDTIKFQDLTADIRRNKEGNWQVMPSLPAPSESPAPEAARETVPLTFRINSLQAGGNNSIHFADESLSRPFKATFHISELELDDLNSADAASPSSFKVKGKVGDYGELAFDGTIKPDEKPVSTDTKGTIGALDMVPFSSYTGQAIGYNVTSGQLDADITMKIDKGMMDGIFDLRMRNLEVAQVDPEKMPEVDKQMNVPLGSALAMLRNKKDEIKLKLELQGDIRNPEFGIQDAINQALAKAMKFATLSYLKYTLQPFGTYIAIAEVVGKAGSEMSKVGLDPVLFPPGEIVLDETANQYLGKIKDLLDNRPKLRIELCGRAVEKDRTAMIERRLAVLKKEAEKSGKKLEGAAADITISDEVLLDFAKERAKLVKELLVTKHSINHERIFVCLPEVDETPEKDPYVVMRLD